LDSQIEDLWRLCQNEWWTKGRSLDEVRVMVRQSDFVFGYTKEDGTLVAFARVLTDHIFRTLVLDVIVDPNVRSRGLGQRLITDISNHPVLGKVEATLLFCKPNLVSFYEQLGFSASPNGVVLMGNKSVAREKNR
ncbi:GNAT family N-acetyltransferase, partial [Petrachloros mirabilis]